MAKKLDKALESLNARIAEGVEYPSAHEQTVSMYKLTDAQATALTAAYDAQPPADSDANKRFRIFNIAVGDKGTASYTRVRVYLLNPGETFARFGGSKHGQTARKTASLIVSTLQCGTLRDVEYDLRGMPEGDTWGWIRRLILREGGVSLPDEE